jgi:16S rRNA C967 or C1407 C5-methylase (RsmB/RsmF family)
VLLDAPCSALGQRPQLRNTIKVKELMSFPKLQKKLLRAAVELVKPGGCIVYSTCTFNVDENEKVVLWAKQNLADQIE